MAHNEFIDNSDRIGITFEDPEDQSSEFLTIGNYRQQSGDSHIEIVLSDTRYVYERSAFTLIMLLGEVGGLYGAIVGIPSIFISNYISLMFMSAIVKLMPFKENDKYET